MPGNAADIPPLSGLQENGAGNLLARRERSVLLALYSKFPLSDKETEGWGAGLSQDHTVAEQRVGRLSPHLAGRIKLARVLFQLNW